MRRCPTHPLRHYRLGEWVGQSYIAASNEEHRGNTRKLTDGLERFPLRPLAAARPAARFAVPSLGIWTMMLRPRSGIAGLAELQERALTHALENRNTLERKSCAEGCAMNN